jgi:acyl-homoserine lactone acylase PvdQ
MKFFLLLLLLPIQLLAQDFSKEEIAAWEKQAKNVTIIRDNWGIPHIYGKTDADAVFGLLYAQCEDDFQRIEANYIEKLGRIAEVKGSLEIYNDLLIKLIIDSADAVKDFNNAPVWLKKLCNAFADGINYYLYKHPNVSPSLLHRFQPWYPLLWTDGSIGAISTSGLTASDLRRFYEGNDSAVAIQQKPFEEEYTGSNGFAIGPSKTKSGKAILYINPHVTLYFRPEVHMVSEEGLNAYGAVTWGQFFVYQGFNEHCGWMHTSSAVDVSDAYIEKLNKKDDKWFYEYDHAQKPVIEKTIKLFYRENNVIRSKTITALFTHHGPVMAKRNNQWLSLRSNNRSVNGIIQSWQRTKANSFADFKKVMDIRANTSNNTVYADAEGNIAYWHGNFIPVRDKKYDWSEPVDGSTSATEWKGIHKLNEIVQVINPANAWIQNCNSTPFTAAGSNSPKKENYPAYMAPDGENFRGVEAVKIMNIVGAQTLEGIITNVGYDTHLPAFEILIPPLIKAFQQLNKSDSLYEQLVAPINTLSNWDHFTHEKSIATTLAIKWGERLLPVIQSINPKMRNADQIEKTKYFAANASDQQLLLPLTEVVKELNQYFGTWLVYWGDINRYQRTNGNMLEAYSDNKPSFPVGFASAAWGQLPSFVSRVFPGSKKRYGTSGNSFICGVEFGKRIKARSLLAGGESGDPGSKHFFDQGEMYSKGIFKDVLFYKEDVLKQAEKTYHPGE